MRSMMTRATGVLLAGFLGILPCAGVSAQAPAAPDGTKPVTILRTAIGERRGGDPGSMWRYFETWRGDITRTMMKTRWAGRVVLPAVTEHPHETIWTVPYGYTIKNHSLLIDQF